MKGGEGGRFSLQVNCSILIVFDEDEEKITHQREVCGVGQC